MKTTKRTFGKLLALALVFLFALTAVVPVLAEPVAHDNLRVVIHNNEGLPAMSEDQFRVYQIFTGTPHREGNPDSSDTSEWSAENWNNYTLADIEWGVSIKGTYKDPDPAGPTGYDYSSILLFRLQNLDSTTHAWAYKDGVNVFAGVETAADLAEVLEEHKDNAFLQNFAKIVAELYMEPVECTCEVTNVSDHPENDYLTFTFSQPGYYLFVEADPSGAEEQDATSEYILAVLGQQEINLKASVPDVNKDIVGSDNTNKGDVAGVGDYVQFKLTGTLPKNFGDFDTYKYVFHDTLSDGLTLVSPTADHPLTVRVYESKTAADEDTKVSGGIVVNEQNGATPEGANYTVTTEDLEDGCSLEISFADLKTLKNNGSEVSVNATSAIVVTYWAQVNTDAVIGSDGNPNTVQLEFSNDPNHDGTGKTKEKKVYVYAFGLDLTKVGDDVEHAAGLGGAGFVLKNADGKYAKFKEQYVGEDGKTFYDAKPEDVTVTGPILRLEDWVDATTVESLITAYNDAVYALERASNAEQTAKQAEVDNAKDALKVYLLVSGTDGKIPNVYGLDEGNYTLKEVITPDGYNTMDDFAFSIDADIDTNGELKSVTYKHGDKEITYKPSYDGDVPAGETDTNLIAHFKAGLVQDTLENQKAPFLPFTGGIGTMIFYVLGTALIAGAITYLVVTTKKRKSAE